MKSKWINLKKEFLSRWKDICVLLFCCIEEMLIFSSFSIKSHPVAIATTHIIIFMIIAIFFTLALKEKKASKADLKKFIIFVILALLFGFIRSYLYIASLLIAYLFVDNSKLLYKWIFIVSTSCFVIYLTFVLLSVIPSISMVRADEGVITNIRHTFGFNHPNHPLKFYCTMIISGYLWLCSSKKSTLIFTVSMLIPALFLAHNTNCRTGLIICVFALISMNFSFIYKLIKTKWLYLLFTLITLFLTISLKLDMHSLNRVLSGRPYFFNYYITTYPEYIIFGKCYKVLLFDMLNYPLDNGFLYILFDGGLFALIAINILFFKVFKNNKDVKLTIVIAIVLAYSLTEALCTVFTNLLYVIMFVELLKEMNNKKSLQYAKEEIK